MQSILVSTLPAHRPTPRRRAAVPVGRDSERPAARRDRRPSHRLARYTDDLGAPREVVWQAGSGGTVLVLDRSAAAHHEARLLAHLSAEEPLGNASLVCRHYLSDPRSRGRCCRALTGEDLSCSPLALGAVGPDGDPRASTLEDQLLDGNGDRYALRPVSSRMSIPQLRWCRAAEPPEGKLEPLSVREVVAALESYEPVRELTAGVLWLHGKDPEVSTAALRAELVRLQESPIVLNRRLREVALEILAREEISMSEIAIRCGRIKRDRKGNESGETSWLARRLGLLPDGGSSAPSPWVHSDVLALIARRGLGLSPREAEV